MAVVVSRVVAAAADRGDQAAVAAEAPGGADMDAGVITAALGAVVEDVIPVKVAAVATGT